MEPAIRKEYFGGVANDEKKVVKALVAQNQENALKTKPKASSLNFLAVYFLSSKESSITTVEVQLLLFRLLPTFCVYFLSLGSSCGIRNSFPRV